MSSFDYSFGIEEEYFVTHAGDASLVAQVPERVHLRAQKELGEVVASELLQSQIEIASPIFNDPDEARRKMRELRSQLNRLLEEDGLCLLAASTHPMGEWRDQVVTDKKRYDQLLSDFRIVGERNLVCGMHVHVAVPEGVDRVRLMNRAMPFLPVFLALSTSSPFWNHRVTGLLSYRQAVYDEWPRSGIPDFFENQEDYDGFIDLLRQVGAIKDGSFVWWAIRPAQRYPTLELRIADVCTRLEDAVAIATLYRCLIAALVENPDLGARRSTRTRRVIDENRWRCKRDGINAMLIDESRAQALSMREVLEELIRATRSQSERLGCSQALQQLQAILERGTSAHMQLRIYNEARAAGAEVDEALRQVVRGLIETTASDHSPAASS